MRKGQSLVEMAIITPLLIFMGIGIFEVGYQIWSHLILTNNVREMGRHLTRTGTYVDVVRGEGLDTVVKRWLTINPQLAHNLDGFQERNVLILTPIEIQNEACEVAPIVVGGEWVFEAMLTPTVTYTQDVRIVWPAAAPDLTRINGPELALRMAQSNHESNCFAIAEDRPQRLVDAMWIVETIHQNNTVFWPTDIEHYSVYYTRDIGQLRGSGLSTGYRATVTPTATNEPE